MSESLINIVDMPRIQKCESFDEWRRNRGTYIGGSDVASILGLSPYPDCQPGNVWVEKVSALERRAAGDVRLDPEMENRFTRWGKNLEKVVLDEYEERMQVVVPRPGWTLMRHSEYPFIGCTLDGDVFPMPHGDKRIAEAKCTDTWTQYRSQMWGDDGSGDIPEWYFAQGMQQLIVVRSHGHDVTMCDFAVLIGGNDFRIFHMAYDEELAEEMIRRQIEFWQMVEWRRPPAFDFSAANAVDLQKKIWRKVEGPTRIVAPDHRLEPGAPTVVELIAKHDAAKREKEDAEKREEAAKAQLMAMTGNASALRIGDSELGVVRKLKAGHHVNAYDVPEHTEFSFQPRFEKKRREILNALQNAKGITR